MTKYNFIFRDNLICYIILHLFNTFLKIGTNSIVLWYEINMRYFSANRLCNSLCRLTSCKSCHFNFNAEFSLFYAFKVPCQCYTSQQKQPANISQAVFSYYSISALTSYPPLKITSISVLLSTLTHSISFLISTLSNVSNSNFSLSISSIILSSFS